MNAARRENLRLLILTAFDASKPFAVGIRELRAGLAITFRGIDDTALAAEIDYLVGKGFAAAEGKSISPENKLWKITAEGRDFLATEGLA